MVKKWISATLIFFRNKKKVLFGLEMTDPELDVMCIILHIKSKGVHFYNLWLASSLQYCVYWKGDGLKESFNAAKWLSSSEVK